MIKTYATSTNSMPNRLYQIGVTAALCLLLLGPLADTAGAQSYPLWGPLQSGPYAVGFTTTWQLDYTRAYDIVFEDSTRYAMSKAPRPILINIWYPAQKQDRAMPMVYSDYLSIASTDPLLQPFSRKLAEHSRAIMINELLNKPVHELTDREAVAWNRFLETPTAALKDAAPAPGPFPLIVYHAGAGSSYEDNAVLHEYLASHGYVIVSSAFQEGDGSSLNTYGGEASLQDMAFLVGYARQMPNVDWQRIAMGGHSAGAQAIMRFQSQPQSVVDALFILDTTQDYHSLSNPLWEFTQTVLDNTHHFTAPMLVVAGPAAIFQLIDRLDQAARYYFTIADVGHNEFISQGVLRQHIAAQHGLAETIPPLEQQRRAEALSKRYQVLCEYLLTFLNAHLKEEPAAIASLADRYRHTEPGAAPHAEHMPRGATVPVAYTVPSSTPPTPRQLRRYFDEQGIDSTLTVLQRFWSADSTHPIYDQTYGFAWVYELLEQGETLAAQALSRQFHTFHDGGVNRKFLRYCNIGNLLNFKEFARDCFAYLLMIDPENAEAQEALKTMQESSH